ncbi:MULTISPECIES: NAD(P)-dependent alcohol dehydrogenase [unclassified Microbacterium]|uniref:NAD(P)-dependent alcohol dehydrogenase n=1 Tax=unclassified Microbacterium TaxID=2609290 RepID=UPI00342D977D
MNASHFTPATTAASMPAWSRDTYGPADGVRLAQRPIPVPRRGEVVLRVEATSLNAGDVRLLLGDPLVVRPAFGLTRPKNPVRGMEVAGTVVELGPEAIGVELGSRMVGELVGGGGLASHVAVPSSRLVAVPPDVPSDIAATLPVAGGTAWQALDLAGVGIRTAGGAPDAGAGRVLVIGASGGVGTFTVQLAALRGAEVWATCGERNARLVEHLGAVRTLDHRREPLSTLPEGHFDAVVDIAGGIPLRDLQRLVRAGGTVVLTAGNGGHVLGPIPRLLAATLRSIGSRRRIRPLLATPRAEVLSALLDLAAEGRITPVIEREYAFEDAGEALRHIEAGHTVGKLIVLSDPSISAV